MRLWFMYTLGNVINDHARLWMFFGNCDVLAIAWLIVWKG